MYYKRYKGIYNYDTVAQLFHGEVANIQRDVITFQGTNLEELKQAFKDSINFYIRSCKKGGMIPERPTVFANQQKKANFGITIPDVENNIHPPITKKIF